MTLAEHSVSAAREEQLRCSTCSLRALAAPERLSAAPSVLSELPADHWLEAYFRYFGAVGQRDVLDSRRRARILLVACHGALMLILVSATLRMALGISPSIGYWVSMGITALAMAAGPLVLQRTGSIANAARLPIAAATTALPVMALGAGGLDAPIVAMLPTVPLITAFFIGSRGAKFVALALVLELGALALALRWGVVSAGPAPPPLVKLALQSVYIGFTAFIAVAYEHERRAVEHRLHALAWELYASSVRDHLTNLNNRRYFAERLSKEISFAARQSTPVSVLILDADRFKLINDLRGHAAGDAVLVDLAQVLSASVRNEDLVARYGGEEFVVLLRGTSFEGARAAAERLRQAVESHPFEHAGNRFTMTVSIGCASATGARTAEDLLLAADRCLYQAKRTGRNCVVATNSLTSPTVRVAASSARDLLSDELSRITTEVRLP